MCKEATRTGPPILLHHARTHNRLHGTQHTRGTTLPAAAYLSVKSKPRRLVPSHPLGVHTRALFGGLSRESLASCGHTHRYKHKHMHTHTHTQVHSAREARFVTDGYSGAVPNRGAPMPDFPSRHTGTSLLKSKA